jgi:hypothetical protein
MRNKLKHHDGRHRGLLYLATIAALLGAGVAGAADTAPIVTPLKDLTDFPHVRVVNAPELATPPATAAVQSGRRVYIDPETGKPRPPTHEELAAQRSEAQKAAALKRKAAPQAEPGFEPQYGGIRVHVGESQMVYSVVRKQESGELAEFCVVGPEQAAKLMELDAASPGALPRKGSRHDR